MPQPVDTAVQVDNVSVHYGKVLALDDASLTVRRGRVCGLIGMNGSGKSTLLKAIMGLVPLDRGRVLIDSADPAEARRVGSIGYVP
ncbi:MAG: ATP-binding cassette domain-containing protein, partial [Gammaproteobacteria bacterium]|nr:ATP-binding cassette domain-containing protein [Gammaproteobacteria bacterium]